MVKNEEKSLAILSHLLGLFISFIGPLIIYLVSEDKNKFVKENSKNALNFQLTVLLAYFISFILMFILIGFLFIFVVITLDLIFSIIGCVKASEGKVYVYPLAIKFIK